MRLQVHKAVAHFQERQLSHLRGSSTPKFSFSFLETIMLTFADAATVTAMAVDQVTSTDMEEAVVDTRMDPLVDMVEEVTAQELAAIACLTLEQVFRSNTGVSYNISMS